MKVPEIPVGATPSVNSNYDNSGVSTTRDLNTEQQLSGKKSKQSMSLLVKGNASKLLDLNWRPVKILHPGFTQQTADQHCLKFNLD